MLRRREDDSSLYAFDMKTQTYGLPLHGDVLEAVVSRISTLDLLPASRVSRDWRTAALSTLRRSPRLPPWLIIHLQSSGGRHRRPGALSLTVAFDPLSRTWSLVPVAVGELDAPSASLSSYVRRSGAHLCGLSSARLALATDPFGATWRYVEPPRYWRTEPAVAFVGPHIVVVGGNSHFQHEASTVEVWTDTVGGWQDGEPVPEAFQWTPVYSVAASDRRMYVLDPKEHVMGWFDPAAKQWGPRRRLSLPAPGVYASAIGFGGGRLILAGISGTKDARVGAMRPESVLLWAVDEETLEVTEVGRMPPEMVKGLVEDGSGGFWGLWSLGFVSEGGYGYVYNATYPKEFFLCEFGYGDRGECRWERFSPPAAMEERPLDRRVFGCSVVSIDDLRKVGLR